MWILLAIIAMVTSGAAAPFMKKGAMICDQYAANAITNTMVFISLVIASVVSGSIGDILLIHNWFLMISSGLTLGFSWLFFYKGLETGKIGAIIALQNLSIIITLAMCKLILNERISIGMIAGAALIMLGTVLMIEKSDMSDPGQGIAWIVYEILSAACISMSFVLTKMDTTPIDTNASSAVRYLIIVGMLWVVVLFQGKSSGAIKQQNIQTPNLYIGGIALGISYILFYKALYLGAAAVVTTIYRINIVPSVIFSFLILHERLSCRSTVGMGLMLIGCILFIF